MQPQAAEAAEVLGDTGASRLGQTLGAGALAATGLAVHDPSVLGAAVVGRGLYTRPVQNWITGRTGVQKAVKGAAQNDKLQAALDALRTYGRSAPLLAPEPNETN